MAKALVTLSNNLEGKCAHTVCHVKPRRCSSGFTWSALEKPQQFLLELKAVTTAPLSSRVSSVPCCTFYTVNHHWMGIWIFLCEVISKRPPPSLRWRDRPFNTRHDLSTQERLARQSDVKLQEKVIERTGSRVRGPDCSVLLQKLGLCFIMCPSTALHKTQINFSLAIA